MRCGNQFWPPRPGIKPSSCSLLCHFPCDCCNSWLHTGSLYRSPARLSLGVDKWVAAMDKRARQMMSFGCFHPCSQEAQDHGTGTSPTAPTPALDRFLTRVKLSTFMAGRLVRIVVLPTVLHQVFLTVLCIHVLPTLYLPPSLSLTSTIYTVPSFGFIKLRPLPFFTK